MPQRLMTALQLAWDASRGRSLFAARCLVAAALQLYARGATADDVQLALSFAGLQSSGARMGEDERDVLISWVALVFMTAEEVGFSAGSRQQPGPGRPASEQPQDVSAADASDAEGNTSSISSTGDGSSESSTSSTSVPGKRSAGSDGSAISLGMRRFVKQAVRQFAGGTRLSDLMELQAAGGSGRQVPPSVLLMQQNTRLIILTLEVLEESGTPLRPPDVPLPPPQQPLEQESQQRQPGPHPVQQQQLQSQQQAERLQQQQQRQTGSLAGASGSSSSPAAGGGSTRRLDPVGYVAAFPADGGAPQGARPAAVRLLIEYMGAMLRSRASAAAFVDTAAACYRRGFTAGELFAHLADEEFEQQGGMLAVALPSQPGAASVSAEIFGRWLSVVYMTLAQLGVTRPELDAADGWAWAGSGNALEAHAIAEFVTNTLRSAPPGLPAVAFAPDSPAMEAIKSAAPDEQQQQQQQRPTAEDFRMVRLEDPSLAATSSSVVALGQQIDLINFAAALADAQGWIAASAGRRQLAWRSPSEQQETDEAAPGRRLSPARQPDDAMAAELRRKESRRHQQPDRAAETLAHGGDGGQQGQQRERQQVPCPWPRRVNRRVL